MLKNVIFGVFTLTILFSCGKVTRNATIERDCTGTYLEMNKRDYLICNPEMVNAYTDGSTVNVKFKKVSECPPDSHLFQCELYHKHFGTVQVTEVKE